MCYYPVRSAVAVSAFLLVLVICAVMGKRARVPIVQYHFPSAL